MPSGPSAPELWLLGSSEYGPQLAAKMGLPFAFAHFISGDAPELARFYRARFRPSRRAAQPPLAIAVAALVAPTDDEAKELALPLALWRLRLLRGRTGPVPSVAEARAYPWTPLERNEVARGRRVLAGSPATVRAELSAVVEEHGADEALIVTIAPDYASRERSYELLARAFAIGERAA